MEFFLKFAFISYASILCFVVGFRWALSRQAFRLFQFSFLALLIAIVASVALYTEPLSNRLIIAAVWTSVLVCGIRFGKKITRFSSRQAP